MSHVSRRTFLKATGAGVAGTAVVSSASSYASILGANDRVRVGIVGFSDRTRSSLIPAFVKQAQELNFEIVAVSDIWSLRRDQGAAYLEKLTGKRPVTTRNNDELYARKDVDAVIVGTADFQHALHGVEAVRAGRDAYVEKPLANTMADARAIRQAVKEQADRADRHMTSSEPSTSAGIRSSAPQALSCGRDELEREPLALAPS
jgi:hypothetical protein